MKKILSMFLAVLLLLTCVLVAVPQEAHAAEKKQVKRAISVVFDNSGSMYEKKNKAWCRATYAMEVFASMLNTGDELQIYPMNPVEVGGKQYTMDTPLVVKDPKEATEKIRGIFTPHKDWKEKKDGTRTHIESIDRAAAGLEKMKGDEKYLVILTDGTNFFEGNKDLAEKTLEKLDERISGLVDKKTMKVMFLGIDSVGDVDVTMPETPESEYFTKKRAKKSEDVLSALTVMCNQIFGRDSLPKKNIPGKKVNFDISMKKLIVFVQGTDISDLRVTNEAGAPVGKLISTLQTKYSTKGTGKETLDNVFDDKLQGMIVTYEDCAAGEYEIQFDGKESSIEAYYEPDADLEFVFTDGNNNTVDPNALYEGTYKVSFGMKDGRTGDMISSELLGKTSYKGSYTHNGKKVEITSQKPNDSVEIELKMDDTFEAELTVTYLSGYTIRKTSKDFGWPEGGIKVAARPAGNLKLEVSPNNQQFQLDKLEQGEPFIVKVFYKDQQLTGAELKKVKWNPIESDAKFNMTVEEDHVVLKLQHKDPNAPQNTACGRFNVTISASYTESGSTPAPAQAKFKYEIKDSFMQLQVSAFAPQDYILIQEMGETQPIEVDVMFKNKALTKEQFARVKDPVIESGPLKFKVIRDDKDPQKPRFLLQLETVEGLEEGEYPVKITVTYVDPINRESSDSDDLTLEFSRTAKWKKIVNWIIWILLAALVIYWICRIRVLPRHTHEDADSSSFSLGGQVKPDADVKAKLTGNRLEVICDFGGNAVGLSMEVEPGPDSYLCKPQQELSMMVKPTTVRPNGNVRRADIGGISYSLNNNGVFGQSGLDIDEEPESILLSDGDSIDFSGTMFNGGMPKQFSAQVQLTFVKE